MKKVGGILLLISIGLLTSGLILAENEATNPVEWLTRLEMEIYGVSGGEGLFERLNRLEDTVIGKVRDDNLINRISYLDRMLVVNQPHDVSLIYKIQALEWLIYKRTYSGSLIERISRVETTLYQRKFNGPLNQRLEKLISQVFPDGVIKGIWVTIPEGLLVKVKIIDQINSKTNKTGDTFRYEVINTVYQDQRVVFPEGMTGRGVLQTVKRPEKLGNDARLSLDFREIRALDGTPVQLSYSSRTGESTHSRQWVVGASTAGLLAFGPGGILVGLAVKGKDKVIPVATEFYLQVTEPVRVFTLKE